MSPITVEMNGNLSNSGLNSSTNSNSNIAVSNSNNTTAKTVLEDSTNSGVSDSDGVNFNNFSSADSTGPMSSTPIGDRSFGDGCGGVEQPTSSTENYNFASSVPKYGTLIPNRVFVGGISCHTTESELLQLFSKYGTVRGTKIIMDRAGVSKGYGFVTFETEEEAKRLYNAMNNREMPPIVHRDRRLNIAPAVKKQPVLRQNTTYSSQGSVGASSTTFSPPPYDSYFYQQGQNPPAGEFYVPPVPMQPSMTIQSPIQVPDGFGYGGNITGHFTSNPGNCVGTTSMGPLFTSIPNIGMPGMGQAIPGPNGSLIFLPLGMPYQQVITSNDQTWNAGGLF